MPEQTEKRAAPCVEAREAAGMLGMSQRAVRKLVASGRLETVNDGAATRVLILTESVDRLRLERHRSA